MFQHIGTKIEVFIFLYLLVTNHIYIESIIYVLTAIVIF